MMDILFSVIKYAIFSVLVLVAADRFEIRGTTITQYVRQTLSHAQRFAQGTPEEKLYKGKLSNGQYAAAVDEAEEISPEIDDTENAEDSAEYERQRAKQARSAIQNKTKSERKKLQSLIQRLGGGA